MKKFLNSKNITLDDISLILVIILISTTIILSLLISLIIFKNELKKYKMDIENGEKWSKFILANIYSSVIILDKDNKIKFLNDYTLNMVENKMDYKNKRFEEVMFLTNESGEVLDLPSNIYEEYTFKDPYILTANNKKFNILVTVKPLPQEFSVGKNLLILKDISYNTKIESLLKNEKDFSKSIIEAAKIFLIVLDNKGCIVTTNAYLAEKTEYNLDELVGKEFFSILVDESEEGIEKKSFNNIFSKNEINVNYENTIISKNGNKINVLWKNSILSDEKSQNYAFVSIGLDISERKSTEKEMEINYNKLSKVIKELGDTEDKLKEQYDKLKSHQELLKLSEERYRLAVEGSNDGLWDWDIKNNRMFFSPRWKEILGYNVNEIDDKYETWINLMHLDDVKGFLKELDRHLNGSTEHFKFEFRLKTNKDEYKWLLCRGKAIWDFDNNPTRIAGSISDISESKNFEDKINKLAYYDNVTGLPNRVYLVEKLGDFIVEAKKKNEPGALIFLDLDNFKTINDTLGHTFGDELLKKVGTMIESITYDNDLAAHFGADEFVIVKPNIDRHLASEIASTIVEAFQKPWMIEDKDFFITASVGVVIFPEDGEDVQTILKNVDMAMYNAKDFGKNKYQIYKKDMNKALLNKLETHNDLRYAIEREEFFIYYQPQIDIFTGKIVSVEALLRWIKPNIGIVQPLKFIPLAEESGLIVQIGEWVLKTACEQIVKWSKEGIDNLNVAVNFSAKQFQLDNITSMVENVIKNTKMNPKRLEVEITESIIMENMESTVNVLNELRKMGAKVSLDDFGTGYSSLNYLKKLPIDMLKIDKSFVNELSTNKDEQAIAKAVIELAHSMHLSVTAEGVETKEQLDFLKNYNCDKAQGFLFSKPVPANEIEILFNKGSLVDEVMNSMEKREFIKK
jgi:diguanylate cyclase (GGDEF)-like protein/PAS domain S-box-containing protein